MTGRRPLPRPVRGTLWVLALGSVVCLAAFALAAVLVLVLVMT